jgi:hypothetical protein
MNGAHSLAVTLLRSPITGIPGRCPSAACGHAAAPPSPAMNSRRLISDFPLAVAACYPYLISGQVFGLDLNRASRGEPKDGRWPQPACATSPQDEIYGLSQAQHIA